MAVDEVLSPTTLFPFILLILVEYADFSYIEGHSLAGVEGTDTWNVERGGERKISNGFLWKLRDIRTKMCKVKRGLPLTRDCKDGNDPNRR